MYYSNEIKNEIKKQAKATIKAIDTAIELSDKVKELLFTFTGKELTRNKKKITDGLKAINPYLSLEIDPYSTGINGIDFHIKYWDSTQKKYTRDTYYHILYYATAPDNILNIDTIAERIGYQKESLKRHKERVIYTAKNIDKIVKKITKIKQELQDLNQITDTYLMEKVLGANLQCVYSL